MKTNQQNAANAHPGGAALSCRDIARIVDRYQEVRADRTRRGEAFLKGERSYLILQLPTSNVWGDVRSTEQCFEENLNSIAASLEVPSDHLPVLEPWFGTGVYANMYGCPYVWRDGEAPAAHYRFHALDEVRNIGKPRWENSEIARLVLDTLRYFKSRTGDAVPMVWTDTQSASDTATLVLDACEVFEGCLLEPETVKKFMGDINDLIIEFSKVQADVIGDALLMPGHIMLSSTGFKGMSVSDDNLAVASPAVNLQFNLAFDEQIGRAMGGVAIHSCGVWTTTMRMIREHAPHCVAVDCAIDNTVDPNPNKPEEVRDALAGSDVVVHVRLTGETERMLECVKRVFHPKLKLIVHPSFVDLPTAERNYHELESLLSSSTLASAQVRQTG